MKILSLVIYFLKYSYFNTILKSSVNNNYDNPTVPSNQFRIKDVQKKIDKKSDIDILNICILEHDDLTKSIQIKKKVII